MLSRKLLMVCAMAFAMIALFASGQALAFSNEPCSQANYNYCNEPPMKATNATWSIILDRIEPSLTPGQYEWWYHISSGSGDFTGSNFVGYLLPDCCRSATPDERIVIDQTASDPDMSCFGVSIGEPTIYFGRYNNQAFVCKGTPDATGKWKIVANTQYKTTSTIIIKSGKDVIQFEMAVPGCPLSPPPTEPLIGSRSYSECSNFGQNTIEPFVELDENGNPVTLPATADDISFYVIRNDDRDGCVSRLWKCIGHDCPDCTTTDGCPTDGSCIEVPFDALPPNAVVYTSFNKTCPDENINVSSGSPYYLYSVNSGGVTYNSCLDLGNYKWVALSYCGK